MEAPFQEWQVPTRKVLRKVMVPLTNWIDHSKSGARVSYKVRQLSFILSNFLICLLALHEVRPGPVCGFTRFVLMHAFDIHFTILLPFY